MTSDYYHKCGSCRYCKHEGEAWTCTLEDVVTEKDGSCGRYRPGCCEFCNSYDGGTCRNTGDEVFDIDVCVDYDPKGSV